MSLQKLIAQCKLKTNYFSRPDNKLSDFKSDQCIIINEQNLSNIVGFEYEKPPKERATSLGWYPQVNSYYHHAEDVCAYERVSELLANRASMTSLRSENDIMYETDPYSEKDAQLQYLMSKPACFVILGKPGIGQEELAKKLADHWKCVYIDPETLIKEEIASGTRAGECIEFNLRCGRAIGIDIVLRLIEKRIKSKTAQHRGFVLTGVPVVPNELYEEDPVSSESAVFNVHEIFEEIFDMVLEIGVPVTKHVSIISTRRESVGEEEPDEEKLPGAEEAEEVPPDLEPDHDDKPPEKIIIDVGSAHEDICQKPVISSNCEEQLHFIFDLLDNPLILIYIRCGNDDVISKRNKYRFHIYSDRQINLQEIEAYTTLHSLFSRDPGSTDYEVPSDLLQVMPYEDISKLQHLVKLPRNFPVNVASQLNAYYLQAVSVIEQHILLHDPQYFLKVDGRYSIENLFSIVKSRLEILPLQKVVLPEKLSILEMPKEGEETDEIVTDLEGMTFEECFRKLRRQQVPNNMFKWNWSEWGKKCPVSMKEGSYKDGSRNFAVHFMNKMFFLADEDAIWKFYCNPRPYLLPPYPKPSCRIFVFGPSASGRTTIAKCLGYLLSSTVLCVEAMREKFSLQKEKEFKEKVAQTAIIEAINELNIQRESSRLYRDALISDWNKKVQDAFRDMDKATTTWEIHENPVELELSVNIDSPHKEYIMEEVENTPPVTITFASNEQWQDWLDDPNYLTAYLPQFLSPESGIDEPATVLDEYVKLSAKRAVAETSYEIPEFSDEDLAEMFMTQIREAEDLYFEQGNNRGGWIVDGMPVNFNILEMLLPDYLADDVIILRDQFKYLLKNYNFDGRTIFRNFRQLFLGMGNVDAAWRSPDSESTASFKKGMIRDIIYDAILNKYNFEDGTEPGEVDETIQEPTWTRSVQLYADNLRTYEESLDQLVEFFTSKQIIPMEVNVSEKSLPDLCKEVAKRIQDRYGLNAVLMSDEDHYEEFQDFGTQNVLAEGMFEGAVEPVEENSFEKNRRYGDTLWYCPVSLYDNWVLWRGKEQCAVMYDNKVYLLATEADVNVFTADPKKYLFGNEPPSKVPPPRICVVGGKSVGKTTIAKALSRNLGIAYIDGANVQDQEDLVKTIWFSNPLKCVGFVVDDFPKNSAHINSMIGQKAIPDLVINIEVLGSELKQRLLSKAIELWKKKTEEEKFLREIANREEFSRWEQARSERLQELLEIKRQERYSHQIESKRNEESANVGEMTDDTTPRSRTTSSQVTYDSFAEQEDIKEIEAMLNKDMPEPIFDDFAEDEEEVAAQLEDEIDQSLADDVNSIQEIRELCELEQIPWVDLDGNMKESSVLYQAYLNTAHLKTRNKSMFERCYDVSLDVAEELLSSGYYFLSKFGKTCPVQYYKKLNPVQMYIPMKEKYHLFPVLHRQFIYFLAGEESWLEFKSNPLKYARIAKFQFPLIPYRISVIGPPKSGKTSLAKRIQNEYSFKLTTCGQAIRHVLRYLPHCHLSKQMEEELRMGGETSVKMQMDSAQAVYFDSHSLTQGIIFDGFPNNEQEVAFLRDLGIVPNLILYLVANDDQVYERLSTLKEVRHLPVYSQKFFNVRYDVWKQNDPIFTSWMDREYQNIARISTDLSAWHIWNQSQKVMMGVFSEIKHYFTHASDDWPLRVANMLVTPLEYLERISEYKSYCPCCLSYDKTLKSGGEIPDRTNLVHFTECFYWICDQHMEEFLEFPELFIPPYNKYSLPKELPTSVTLKENPADAYEGGICMVCYSQEKQKKIFSMGVYYFAVTYNGHVYLFDTQDCMDEFLARPHLYASLVIAYKDPKNMSSLKYNELPILGYLEQYIANDVIKAVNDVVKERPLIPGLSVSSSAALHMALFLKINCSETKRLERYKTANAQCVERKEKFVRYLQQMKRFLNPNVYYEEPVPKLTEYTPDRNVSDFMRQVLHQMLGKVNYEDIFYGV